MSAPAINHSNLTFILIYDLFTVSGNAFTILMLLASLNSCTNPWIYLAFSGHLCNKARGRFSRPPASSFLDSGTRSTMMETTVRRGGNRRESEYSGAYSTSNFWKTRMKSHACFKFHGSCGDIVHMVHNGRTTSPMLYANERENYFQQQCLGSRGCVFS